jgi:hypothetical protein
MPLLDVLAAVTHSWRKLQSQKAYRSFRKNMIGSIKALEITWGPNGWHPHLHVLLFLNPGLDPCEAELGASGLVSGWRQLVGDQLGVSPSLERAMDFRYLDTSAAAYISKVAKEIAMADTKSTRSPFALLDLGETENYAQRVAQFIEYVTVTRSRQSFTWSKGLRELLDVAALRNILAVASLEDSAGVVVLTVERDEWNRMWCQGEVGTFLVSLEQQLVGGPSP